MKVAILGGGIVGLGFALGLHARGIDCEVFEAVADIKEIGVGITLLPHTNKELAALGLLPQLEEVGIENLESVFYNRFGQYIYKELRGRHAGYATPELGIHRGKLHRIMFDAAMARLGADRIHTGYRCIRVDQTEQHAIATFQLANGDTRQVQADVAVACDGVNSAVRKQLFPDDKVCFAGINTWRGVTVHKPILTGKSYIRIGSIDTGKMVIYPIVDNVDGKGNQLINWTSEIRLEGARMNDWNKPGNPADTLEYFKDCKFPWLDVPNLIMSSERVFEYPMVDKDAPAPVELWPRHPDGRCSPPHVPAWLQWLGTRLDRRPHSGRYAGAKHRPGGHLEGLPRPAPACHRQSGGDQSFATA